MSEVELKYCNKCVYYETCKTVIRAGLKHKNKKFPEIGECELYKPKEEEKMQSERRHEKMNCNDCAYYKICKSLNNTGIFAKFPKVDFCPLFEPNSEEKFKESEKKKMQPAVSTALQAILVDRGYKVLEITTFSGAKFVGTNIQIKFNNFLLTKCVYCNDEFFSTIQNISEVRILFFS